MTPKQLRDSANRPWERPTPGKGQIWRVGEDRWYLRRRTSDGEGRIEFKALEVNGRRRATITQEFLEDADPRVVEFVSTLSEAEDTGGIDGTSFFGPVPGETPKP